MILSEVVAGLLGNPKRKFSVVEQAFFQACICGVSTRVHLDDAASQLQLYYENQTPALQTQIQSVVASGQVRQN
jgi:cytochrome c-type biogenesis protein CcmE